MLSLLSSELFESIQSRPDEEISKLLHSDHVTSLSSGETLIWKLTSFFLLIAGAFGEQIGGLLNSQAECEKDFETVNVIDAVHMEPLDSEMFESGHDRRAA